MRIRKRRALVVLLFPATFCLLAFAWFGTGAAEAGAGAWGGTPAPAARGPAPAPAARGATTAPAAAASNEGKAFFESKIRPVLVKECYPCHSASAAEPSSGLFLDTRQGMRRGGDRGPAVTPNNVEGSLIIKALRYTNNDLQMPPKGKLADATIKDFESWIRMGAPDTRDGTSAVVKKYNPEASKSWWSFQPLARPSKATVKETAWPRGEIDRYVLAGLEAKNLKPVADADKATLIRRLTVDLIGLPSTAEGMDAFVQDKSPDALAKIVDQLMASPQFGERWGRHWLDVARYAESTGKDINMTYPNAWRYRDYVIDSFNADKPYDQFIKEQLAGDLLPAATPKKRAEQLIATGFLAIGPKGLNEKSTRQFELDVADEQVAATAQAFMALTVNCARCHDHRFDPILQKDYYGMAGMFLSSKTKFGTLPGPRSDQDSDLIELPAAANLPAIRGNLTIDERATLTNDSADATAALNALLAQRGRGAPQGLQNQIQQAIGIKAHLDARLNAFEFSGKPKAFAMGVEDRPPTNGRVAAFPAIDQRRGQLVKQVTGFETIADSPIFFRGEATEPRERVPRVTPVFLSWSGTLNIPANTSGRRELASWIASPRNPLTARVMANRIWMWLMGQGIVASVDNFGSMGESPANQALLDYLAGRLIDNGWSVKKTIREIVLSRAYGLASTYDETSFTADPQNALIWRHSPRRLDAETLRDGMLLAAGQLNLKPPVGSMVAIAGDGAVGTGAPFMRVNDNPFINAAGLNRSIYLPALRDVEPDALGLFDYPDNNTVNGQREATNVPSQALYLINNNYVRNIATQLAARVVDSVPGNINQAGVLQGRVNFAFRNVFGRNATASEQKAAEDFFRRMITTEEMTPQETWIDFCLALYNTAEFRLLK